SDGVAALHQRGAPLLESPAALSLAASAMSDRAAALPERCAPVSESGATLSLHPAAAMSFPARVPEHAGILLQPEPSLSQRAGASVSIVGGRGLQLDDSSLLHAFVPGALSDAAWTLSDVGPVPLDRRLSVRNLRSRSRRRAAGLAVSWWPGWFLADQPRPRVRDPELAWTGRCPSAPPSSSTISSPAARSHL